MGTHRILVVDDLEPNRLLLSSLVESLGYDVETACDGMEALARLPLDIDLVLLDVLMPGLDGFEVVRRLRELPAHRDLPVIMVTALDSREERAGAIAAGADDFIAKPIDRTELRVRIRAQLSLKDVRDALKRHEAELEQVIGERTAALRQTLQETREAHGETQEAHLDTIRRLVSAAEVKDPYCAGHAQRISRYVSVLAAALHLPPGEAEMLRHALPMHDVGKIGIPDAVLLKPGPLTTEERQVIQGHARIGANLLAGSPSKLMQAGEVVALTHHERWDGSGYPSGLAGTAIPFWGRLCAVADTFDALTSGRPYRSAFTDEAALTLLRQGRGSHFDPALCDLFLDLFPEIAAVRADCPLSDGLLQSTAEPPTPLSGAG